MQIKFLKNVRHDRTNYAAGAEAVFSEAVGRQLVALGLAIEVFIPSAAEPVRAEAEPVKAEAKPKKKKAAK